MSAFYYNAFIRYCMMKLVSIRQRGKAHALSGKGSVMRAS